MDKKLTFYNNTTSFNGIREPVLELFDLPSRYKVSSLISLTAQANMGRHLTHMHKTLFSQGSTHIHYNEVGNILDATMLKVRLHGPCKLYGNNILDVLGHGQLVRAISQRDMAHSFQKGHFNTQFRQTRAKTFREYLVLGETFNQRQVW